MNETARRPTPRPVFEHPTVIPASDRTPPHLGRRRLGLRARPRLPLVTDAARAGVLHAAGRTVRALPGQPDDLRRRAPRTPTCRLATARRSGCAG